MTNIIDNQIIREKLKKIINHIDPINLIKEGAPEDEYENEINKVKQPYSWSQNGEFIVVACKKSNE